MQHSQVSSLLGVRRWPSGDPRDSVAPWPKPERDAWATLVRAVSVRSNSGSGATVTKIEESDAVSRSISAPFWHSS